MRLRHLKLSFCIAWLTFFRSMSFAGENIWFHAGLLAYQNNQYDKAISLLEKAIQMEPDRATYHHMLAKSYGRKAEQANWFSAMKLAKKTLVQLEIAIKLDHENVAILADLMEFYSQAPPFLGGDTKKANKIRQSIKKLTHKKDGADHQK